MGPKVVIIGAGVVGAAVADELAQRGWDDIVVLEQGAMPAPGGSSSHAPGLVFQTNGAKVMAEMASYTVHKLSTLDCFRPVGSLEVATTTDRLAELHRRQGWATAWGIEARVLSGAEAVARHDLLDPDLVLGALHVPSDGLARSVAAVTAQLGRAAERGVRVLDRHRVLDIRTTGDRVSAVVTDRGEIPADLVVCCAGIWGPTITRMVGLSLPLIPLAHQFAWTEQLPALRAAAAEATRPIVRHQAADLYFRERYDQLGIGSYAHDPIPLDADDIPTGGPMPSVLPFTASDFAPSFADAAALFPALRETRVAQGFNGLFSFTTDNMPLLGPSPQVDGFWVAEAVWVTHSAGVGRAMAEWLVDGHCESFDLHECDVNRFEPHQLAPPYVRTKGCRNYVEVYDILHPLDPMAEPRPLRRSPFHPRQEALGAYFLEASGWERPQWYEANEGLLDRYPVPFPDPWAGRHWSPIIGAEALAARESVALFDMTPLKRLEVSGPGATEYLRWMTTGDIDKSVGSITYCLLLDVDGGVRGDITVARLGPDSYQVGVNSNLDLDWLRRPAPVGVSVRDLTPGTCCVGLWGPRARDVLTALTRDDFSGPAMRYFRARDTFLGSVPVTAMRLSYVGELGWELYTTADLGLTLWDLLWTAGQDHGIIAAGRGAFNSMRLEKGYRSFGVDLTFEHDPYSAGLGFAVKLDKGDFLGREALAKRHTDPPRRVLACLTIAAAEDQVMGREPVYHEDTPVGHVTSAGYGYSVGTGIAYAWLPAALATVGQILHIGYFDRRIPAVVTAEPLFDPTMSRLRG